jgi:REP element-mobilizing transposase RayT
MRFQNRKIAKLVFQVLKEAKQKFGCIINIFTLMGNHKHKVLQVGADGRQISKIMHWINFTIAMRYNKITGHKGHLWRERFKSYVIQDWNYFINCMAYIIRNPERANIALPEDYPFGSAIFLYKLDHPFPEFQEYRDIFTEPFEGCYALIKEYIATQRKDEKASQ